MSNITDYEFINISVGRLVGSTYGCGCCSDEVEIKSEKEMEVAFAKSIAEYEYRIAHLVNLRDLIQRHGFHNILAATNAHYDGEPTYEQQQLITEAQLLGLL